jgi:DNA-binding GntR family transcriptional regulator
MSRRNVLPQLKPANLRQQARDAIHAQIVKGDVEPGTIYPVVYFSSQLGVSATPVREALYDLVHEGLFEVVRNRGFRVLDLSERDLDEILQLRLMLEVPAVREAAGRLTPEDINECARYAQATQRHAAAGEYIEFFEADREFHLRMLAPVENRRLVDMIARLRDQTRLPGTRSLTRAGIISVFATVSAEEHHRILAAVGAGDADEAERLMRSHLQHTRELWADRAAAATP